MSTEDYTIDELTPLALQAVVDDLGGGMVQSVVLGAEVVTADGDRRFLALWDTDSSIANQLGIVRLLTLGIEARAQAGWAAVDDEIEDLRG